MPPSTDKDIVSQNAKEALVGGCHQISFSTRDADSPLPVNVSYRSPSGATYAANGWAKADGSIHARFYVSEPGKWTWEAKSAAGRGIATGEFAASDANLPGKLRVSSEDSRQFRFSNGEPYLHLGDNAFRLLAPEEPRWQAYIDQAAQAGFTKLRAWLPGAEDDAGCFYDSRRVRLDLRFWDAVDERLLYALKRHPRLQFQLILFARDRGELERYEEGDALTHLAARYAMQRLAPLPNVHWSLASDVDLVKDSAVTLQALSQLGKYVRENAPPDTLITCGQTRFSRFLFDKEPWCSMGSLGSLGQVNGEVAAEHRALTSKPLALDEDRSEHGHSPLHPRYYFRRLFWAQLLSGAHPTYEGLNTRHPSGMNHRSGIYGYYDACHSGRLRRGADDLLHIRSFFNTLGINLEGWVPDDGIGGNKPLLVKAMRARAGNACILYVANPDAFAGHSGKAGAGLYTDAAAQASETFTTFSVELPFPSGIARWFSPSAGQWRGEIAFSKPSTILITPEPGDWTLWVERT